MSNSVKPLSPAANFFAAQPDILSVDLSGFSHEFAFVGYRRPLIARPTTDIVGVVEADSLEKADVSTYLDEFFEFVRGVPKKFGINSIPNPNGVLSFVFHKSPIGELRDFICGQSRIKHSGQSGIVVSWVIDLQKRELYTHRPLVSAFPPVIVLEQTSFPDPNRLREALHANRFEVLRQYKVALSYAGEDRQYVEEVANTLKKAGVTFFYDIFELPNLLGKNLDVHLNEVYTTKATFCVVFLSKHYMSKRWTQLEFEAAQRRAAQQANEYILPVVLDDVNIPNSLANIAYLDGRKIMVAQCGEIILQKINANR